MSRRTRRTHSPSFKAKVALAAVRGDRTLKNTKNCPVFSDHFLARRSATLKNAGKTVQFLRTISYNTYHPEQKALVQNSARKKK